jgi:hypothetical protein
MTRRRSTTGNDQSDCDLNFSPYARAASAVVAMAGFPVWIEAPKYSMLRQERRFDEQDTQTEPATNRSVDSGHL